MKNDVMNLLATNDILKQYSTCQLLPFFESHDIYCELTHLSHFQLFYQHDCLFTISYNLLEKGKAVELINHFKNVNINCL